ncbi:coiled-coil domain-containing protein 152 isoform X1 [Stigmatopora nigra]
MARINGINLDQLTDEFIILENKIGELNSRNIQLEAMVEDANRKVKYHESKEKSVTDERNSLLATVNKLQLAVQKQCNLRGANETLKNDMAILKQQTQRTEEGKLSICVIYLILYHKDGEAEIQRLLSEIEVHKESHKRETEILMQECKMQVEKAHKESFARIQAQEAEVKKLLGKKDLELEEMNKKMEEQERKQQSELLKLKIELARTQNTVQMNQHQQKQHSSVNAAQDYYTRKLHFVQDEKNKQILSLNQRIEELQDNHRPDSLSTCLKRKRPTFT